ncbi:MAG: alpha/beta hydrolase [Clostridiales bacterium]|nr:alpha/beta hydrolase [Clostridiales bacterium]
MRLYLPEQKSYPSARGDVAYWIVRHADQTAPCIFFLHGLTADHTLFEHQMPYFAERYTVIAWDAPAHALSRPYSDFSYENCAQDVRGILLSEGFDRAVLAGQSMGGYIAQTFLLHYPEMASAFVAIDTCPFGLRYYSNSDLFWLAQAGWFCWMIPHAYYVDTIVKNVALTESGRQNMRKALSFYDNREFCELNRIGLGAFVKENQDLDIPCPVLILVGEKDKAGKVLAYSNAWHEATGYPMEIIRNASHNSNYDNPTAVNAAIDDFLNKVFSDWPVLTRSI